MSIYQLTWIDIIIIAAVVIAGAAFGVWRFRKNFKVTARGFDVADTKKRWNELMKLMEVKKTLNCKLAVIEADKLLDSILQEMKFDGETVGDRLKLAAFKFPKLKNVIWAHKMRNILVNDENYFLKYTVAFKVLRLYRKALKDLGAM